MDLRKDRCVIKGENADDIQQHRTWDEREVMDMDERVERWEADALSIDELEGESIRMYELIRDIIADWKRLKAENARLRHIFSLQALDDVE